jgi:hypothetical protein
MTDNQTINKLFRVGQYAEDKAHNFGYPVYRGASCLEAVFIDNGTALNYCNYRQEMLEATNNSALPEEYTFSSDPAELIEKANVIKTWEQAKIKIAIDLLKSNGYEVTKTDS